MVVANDNRMPCKSKVTVPNGDVNGGKRRLSAVFIRWGLARQPKTPDVASSWNAVDGGRVGQDKARLVASTTGLRARGTGQQRGLTIDQQVQVAGKGFGLRAQGVVS